MNDTRLWQRLMHLAEIGARGDGGVDRQALTAGEIEAWRLILAWAAEVALEPSTDAAGNLFLTLPGHDRTLPPALIGSHIDTQPNGGRFDGAFGVLAALEAVATLAEAGITPARDITVVAWMNEEGSRFAPGMMGSEAFVGLRDLATIRAVRDAQGISVGDALDTLHGAFAEMPRRPLGFTPAFYIEPHIEQGPLLEQAGLPLGIVTGIQGKITWEVVLDGEEGHAGTLDMAKRRDAVIAFARIATRMQREVGDADPIVKFTIGRVTVQPNAPSVVAGRVTFRIDLRHPDNAALQAHGARLEAAAAAEAAPCGVTMTRMIDAPSNEFDAALRGRLMAAARRLGFGAMPILSAAGHDARHMAAAVPCRDDLHTLPRWHQPFAGGMGRARRRASRCGAAGGRGEGTDDMTDMADLPVQHPQAPASDAAARARFFNSGNAFNIKLSPVPAADFAEQAAAAMAPAAPTGIIACDQSAAIGCAFPATTPLMLARYAVIREGETLDLASNATGLIGCVLRGAGTAPDFAWGAGDIFLLPGGAQPLTATEDAVLWLVGNEPMLAFEGLLRGPRAARPRALPGGRNRAPARPDRGLHHQRRDLGPRRHLFLRWAGGLAQHHAEHDAVPQHPAAGAGPACASPQLGSDHAGAARRGLPFQGRWRAAALEPRQYPRHATGRAAFAPQCRAGAGALPDRAGRWPALPRPHHGL